jgi:hypothetical protein
LKLLDHEAWNWSKSNLGRRWFISSEKFLELLEKVRKIFYANKEDFLYLLLGKIIREISNHDLVLGRNTVSWWTALPTLAWLTSSLWFAVFFDLLRLLGGLLSILSVFRSVGQWKSFRSSSWNLSTFLALGLESVSKRFENMH